MKINKLLITGALITWMVILLTGCCNDGNSILQLQSGITPNVLDYASNPGNPYDKSSLVFSDQGAWFGYGLPTEPRKLIGFSGPFLMTQENGVWCSNSLNMIGLVDGDTNQEYDWNQESTEQNAYPGYLEQIFKNEKLVLNQKLFFVSPHSVMITTEITNISNDILRLKPSWEGTLFDVGIRLVKDENTIKLISHKSKVVGYINVSDISMHAMITDSNSYRIELSNKVLNPGDTQQLLLTQTFIFPEYNMNDEVDLIYKTSKNPKIGLNDRITEKKNQLAELSGCFDSKFSDSVYNDLVVKCLLTMQNNWRSPAGELKHSGLFPSYHYKWFNGFWAWDSWKHAAALAQYNTELAKDQMRAMYDYMDKDGFIADCIYRDTTIENHNFRNTKPPLSAWAVWQIFENNRDTAFLRELYPQMKKQHYWWYTYRDHDGDSVCEYGSTDGTLVAAKWESGMDNAVRFDNSELNKNKKYAYSLNQESVDLNSYLYAEKQYLAAIADVIEKWNDADTFLSDGNILKTKIQHQFYDKETGWFYDTSLGGHDFVDVMGCEGWIPLWAAVATDEQATMVMKNMMDSTKFNTKVPLQTLSADHMKFKPDGGYWRGPTWLDQAYFGVVGLRNYGFDNEADELMNKLIHNAEGVMEKGKSIRENYNPITGEGLESENFSWSAAHYLLLLKTR